MAKTFPLPLHRIARALAVILALASPASAEPAHGGKPAAAAQKPLAQALTGQAKADYESGKLLFGDGDYAGALIKLESAYELSKDPRLLYNIATCQKSQRHYAKALSTLRRYLVENAALSAAERKDVQETINALDPFTTKLTLKASEDGAEVTIDGEPAGKTPLAAPVVVDIGERHLRLTKEGFAPFEKTIPVGGSAEVSVEAKLEKVVRVGRLTVNAPAGAVISLDGKEAGVGKVEQVVAAGGHQLRVTAPAMRPYQSEIVVQDKETRTIDVALEAEAQAELPKLRVAVGCGDDRPIGPDEGLVAYLDGNDVLPSSNVRRIWDSKQNANTVEYVEYPAQPGPHTLRLRSRGCLLAERSIAIAQPSGGDVSGALELDKPVLFKGPQGSPGWGRVGAALWMPFSGSIEHDIPESYRADAGSLTGVAVDVGLVTRWFSFGLDYAYAGGSAKRTS
ncbi:MAG TPA: PEGA domain-containing protein, partial [Polyangiaceae bacterium]